MIKKPEIESVRLWMASETMAIEFENRPISILNIARNKLISIKRHPDFTIASERDFAIVLF